MPFKMGKVNKERPLWKGIGQGLAFALGISVGVSAVLSLLVFNGKMNEETMHIASHFIQAISVLIGCIAATAFAGGRYAILIGAVSAIYFMIALSANILFFDGDFSGVIGSIVSIVIGAGCCLLICLMKMRGRAQKHHRYR